jgi:integrase
VAQLNSASDYGSEGYWFESSRGHNDDFKLVQEEIEILSLNNAELRLIEKIKLSSFPLGKGLSITRDMFLFSCNTGLRYSDVIALTKKDLIDGNCINMKMKKTKKNVKVPLTNKAKIILEKYSKSNIEPIFPFSLQCNS